MQSLLVTVDRAAGTADDAAVETALKTLRQGADVTVAARSDEAELVEALAINALDRVGRLGPRDPSGSFRGHRQ